MNKRNIYWQARMMADEKRAHAIAGNASKEINGMYRRQYLKIVKQMELLSAQIDRGGTLTRTQLWNYSRWKELEKLLSNFVSEATRINTDSVHAALEEVFKNTIGSGTEEFASGRPQLQTAAVNVIDTDWSGSNYSARIWHNQAAIADGIKNSMEDMLIQGRGLPDIKKRLMREFGVAFNDADRLVRTEAAYVLNRAAVERYKNANLKKVRWSTGPEDGNECAICAARSNKVYEIGSQPMIPAHPRCRCIYVGVVELPGEDVDVDGPQLEAAFDTAKALTNNAKSGIIYTKNAAGKSVKTVKKSMLRYKPDSITQVISKNGGISRNYYDHDGNQAKQISNNDHGHPSEKGFGKHGEHAHDYIRLEDGTIERMRARELTDEERKENGDIL